MNYAVIDKTFCGLQQRTKGKCATSEEMCEYTVNHFTKELSFKGNDTMQSYQGTPAPWKTRSDIIQTVKIEGITSIGSYALDGLIKITELTIPTTITTIGDYAFNGCSGITKLNYPITVTAPVNAFEGCSSITSLKIIGKPNEELPMQNFGTNQQPWYNQRRQINKVEIEETVTTIGTNAFEGMTSLKTISIHDKITTIGEYALRSSGITEINLNKVKTIGQSSFESCSSLATVTMSSSTEFTTISINAFKSCVELISIEIPSSVKSISDNAFYG